MCQPLSESGKQRQIASAMLLLCSGIDAYMQHRCKDARSRRGVAAIAEVCATRGVQ